MCGRFSCLSEIQIVWDIHPGHLIGLNLTSGWISRLSCEFGIEKGSKYDGNSDWNETDFLNPAGFPSTSQGEYWLSD
jgi:hypothetical protein